MDDVLVLADYWQSELVEDVNFLAVVEEHCYAGERGPEDPPTAVLLGSPVFVFKAD